eukprot:scaffold5973_cov42-Prasinocladus_malaysianus.AAC.4
MVTDLAVPDSPTNRHGLPVRATTSIRKVERTVSTVGTRILENWPSAGGRYSSTRLFQATQ